MGNIPAVAGAKQEQTSTEGEHPLTMKSLWRVVSVGRGESTLGAGCVSDLEVDNTPISMVTAEEVLAKHTNPVSSPPDEMCSICMVSLQEESDFHDPDEKEGPSSSKGVVKFVLCRHVFHLVCVQEMMKNSSAFLQCPYCKTIHGLRVGNQPTTGRMTVAVEPALSLPGHPDCGTITITYRFRSGIQGPEHPNPGLQYKADSFPRFAFLPNNEKGKLVLKLLKEAWRRRLIFTVGTSATSGRQNVITWNDIHHKTDPLSNWNGHGYPDENYLDNVLMELQAVGVTEESIGQ